MEAAGGEGTAAGGVGSRALASPAASSRALLSPSVRPLGKPATGASSTVAGAGTGAGVGTSSVGTNSAVPRDPRAVVVVLALRNVARRRLAVAFGRWRGAKAADERARAAAFQALMESRSTRICVRYGRDKLYALLQARAAGSVRLAFERWRSAAVVDHARAVLSRSRLQVQVALDQARAERGVYERAELAAARDKRAVMLTYAFLRWRDLAALAPLAAELAAAQAQVADVVTRTGRVASAVDACRDSIAKSLAGARDEGDTFARGLVAELAAGSDAPPSAAPAS